MEKSDWDSLGLVNLPGENDVELDHHHHHLNNNTKADGKVVVVIAIRIWLILLTTIILGQVPVQK